MLLINRLNINETRFSDQAIDPSAIPENTVLLSVDRVSLTANNITYAVLGERMKYWHFFPTEDGWGKLPVWGFANVIASTVEGIDVGERFYGFYPLARQLLVEPARMNPFGFRDGASHRAELPPIYNHYARCNVDPIYSRETENLQALLRPLFTTSFLLDDFMAESDFQGAFAVLISSASSKTSLSLAFLLKQKRNERRDYKIVGLTSPRNIEFTNNTGLYDRVVEYDAVKSLDSSHKVAFADMAGNADLTETLHTHFRENMLQSCQIGLAHWQDFGVPRDLPGAAPKWFFAPDQAVKRTKEWGAEDFQQRLAKSWHAFIKIAGDWLQVEYHSDNESVQNIYLQTLAGKASPTKGHIITLK
ncbi:MAG: DUF2855 family protein [Calditrichia bacterium]